MSAPIPAHVRDAMHLTFEHDRLKERAHRYERTLMPALAGVITALTGIVAVAQLVKVIFA